ncbi:MAG: class I SAM-dependent methyltransferase [Hyphomicrobium sp.]
MTSGPGTSPMLRRALYGVPPRELVAETTGATQVSPRIPGSKDLEDLAPQSLDAVAMLAPAGTVERRRALALALTALRPGGTLTALAPKDKGGARLKRELESFGCAVNETSKAHHRICVAVRPDQPSGLEAAIEDGALRMVDGLGLWSQPGLFSWDRIDPASRLLAGVLPPLAGHGADLGCGYGYLATVILASPEIEELELIDIDRRAIEASRRNVTDSRAIFHWVDVVSTQSVKCGLDFVVMNPPFHDGCAEDRALGQTFIRRAAERLRSGGRCWITANRHLPYEAVLRAHFKSVALAAEQHGYKVYEALR